MLTARTRPRVRRAATLLEIAVAVAILGVLGALVYPTVSSVLDRRRVLESIAVLRSLTASLDAYDTLNSGQGVSCTGTTACDRAVGRYPRQLRHLLDSISTTNTNSCNTVYVAGNVTGWRTYGPFWSQEIVPTTGFKIPIGFVRDILVRTPATAADAAKSHAILQIQIDSIHESDLRELSFLVDGFHDGAQGTVRWTAAANTEGIVQPVFWTFPVGGC